MNVGVFPVSPSFPVLDVRDYLQVKGKFISSIVFHLLQTKAAIAQLVLNVLQTSCEHWL
jgi:uncharacterized protein YqjF (DUF2071 family)